MKFIKERTCQKLLIIKVGVLSKMKVLHPKLLKTKKRKKKKIEEKIKKK